MWEYLKVHASEMTPGNLAQFGKDGWELVTIYQAYAYFRRPARKTVKKRSASGAKRK